ncbi:MAG TPA: methionyl-tRNA formyltransferase [Sulfurimonas autotrophica]|nr:methionyl-tRNA formyltransferase [Sulfurimonas autotrophica]
MKVAILTSLDQWFVPYAKKLQTKIDNAYLFFRHEDIDDSFEIVFILSYHKIIQKEYLKKHKHNIVIHESALPKGKGWAPMFWQILEDENNIPFAMFEASPGVDDGNIYMQETLTLSGYELNEELREKQANFTSKMCLEFLNNYDRYKVPKKQTGKESFYAKRSAKDSQLDVKQSIEEQFNLLRIVNNEEYPAFFEIDNHKYKLTIEKMEK